ncbi:DUF2076 domain-containing protein [Erwinia sp. 9145]|uniref:DUF2076 domain-containing protein n=1 Tax=Erwinia sp. 9145 TaxID=1500895 RepID=UPI0005561A57|nr:DUF2076 domain-containing protein [Erwinia sp. 9145]
MQSQEQQLIESLFSRLKQAETQSGPRDAAAENLIHQQVQQQPAAVYYMAQTVLIQEAAMKQLNDRVSELEARLKQVEQQPARQSSGGFLSGLFGGGQQRQPAPQQQPAWNSAPQQQQQPFGGAGTPSATRGFLGGALQTAVGVAGGVVMADMLTSMFHHTQPEEIVNIINEPAQPQASGDNAGEGSFLDQNDDLQQDYAADDFSDYNNDDFGDDDTFV